MQSERRMKNQERAAQRRARYRRTKIAAESAKRSAELAVAEEQGFAEGNKFGQSVTRSRVRFAAEKLYGQGKDTEAGAVREVYRELLSEQNATEPADTKKE